MADPKQQWFTTGGVARLCSVKPDTVQKWIRSGRIAAQRTAGGHYRIGASDIEPFLTRTAGPRWFAPPPAGCRPQPLRCWEYLSDNGVTRDECKKCAVYRVRAAWCFEVLGIDSGLGHSRQFCRGQNSCDDCAYYQRVRGAAVTVLVITGDQALVSRLSRRNSRSLTLLFSSSAYEASMLIGASRPGFVILDEDLGDVAEPRLLEHLLRENRRPGLKIILCGSGEKVPPGTPRPAGELIIGRLYKPFDRADISILVDSIPVERRPVQADPPLAAAAPERRK